MRFRRAVARNADGARVTGIGCPVVLDAGPRRSWVWIIAPFGGHLLAETRGRADHDAPQGW